MYLKNKKELKPGYGFSSSLYWAMTCRMTAGPGAPRVVRFSTQVFREMASYTD